MAAILEVNQDGLSNAEMLAKIRANLARDHAAKAVIDEIRVKFLGHRLD